MTNPPDAKDIEHRYAGVLLVTESGKIIGQRRDDKPTIDNPNKIGTFGGTVEAGETPIEGAWRELVQEETNLKLHLQDLKPFWDDVAWRELTQEWEARYFYYAEIMNQDLDTLEIYEGQGWAYIDSQADPDLIDLWRPVVAKLFEKIGM